MSTMAASTHTPSATRSSRPGRSPHPARVVAGNRGGGCRRRGGCRWIPAWSASSAVSRRSATRLVSPDPEARDGFGNGQRRLADRCDLTDPIRAEVVVRNVRAAHGIEHDSGLVALATGCRFPRTSKPSVCGTHQVPLNRRIAELVAGHNPVRSPGAALGREESMVIECPTKRFPEITTLFTGPLAVRATSSSLPFPTVLFSTKAFKTPRVACVGLEVERGRRVG